MIARGEFHVPTDPGARRLARGEGVTRAVAAHCSSLPLTIGQIYALTGLARAAERAGFSAAAAVALANDRADRTARGELRWAPPGGDLEGYGRLQESEGGKS